VSTDDGKLCPKPRPGARKSPTGVVRTETLNARATPETLGRIDADRRTVDGRRESRADVIERWAGRAGE
jgi:hypothetical protein